MPGSSGGGAMTPESTLQQLCESNRWPPPTWRLFCADSPSGAPMYVFGLAFPHLGRELRGGTLWSTKAKGREAAVEHALAELAPARGQADAFLAGL